MTAQANQLEMMESGNSQYIGLGSPTRRVQEVQKAGEKWATASFIGFNIAVDFLLQQRFSIIIIDCFYIFL